MNSEQFNEKYKQYIPSGWYGLSFDIPEVTEYLDNIMQDLITIPGFKLFQIKLKFGMARFYFETSWISAHLEAALVFRIEDNINQLVKEKLKIDKL